MPIIIETPRLIMKQFSEADAKHLFELNSDPDVTKYVGDPPYNSMDEVYEFIRNYDQYQKYGMGRLNMFDKQTSEYIGWCGLKYIPGGNYVDLGYRLLKRHWAKVMQQNLPGPALNMVLMYLIWIGSLAKR